MCHKAYSYTHPCALLWSIFPTFPSCNSLIPPSLSTCPFICSQPYVLQCLLFLLHFLVSVHSTHVTHYYLYKCYLYILKILLSFWIWLILFNIIISRSIYFPAIIMRPPFFLGEYNPFYSSCFLYWFIFQWTTWLNSLPKYWEWYSNKNSWIHETFLTIHHEEN